MIEWVDANLREWGGCVRGSVCKLDYPSSSIEARMADGALSLTAVRSMPMVYFPGHVELTEAVILRMPDYLVQVAIVAYTTRDEMTRTEQARLLTRRLGRSVSTTTLGVWIDALHHQYDGYYRAMMDLMDEKKLTVTG